MQCLLCNQDEESVQHLMQKCPIFHALWRYWRGARGVYLTIFCRGNFWTVLIEFILHPPDHFIKDKILNEQFSQAVILNMVGIWRMRNELLKNITPSIHTTGKWLRKLQEELMNIKNSDEIDQQIRDGYTLRLEEACAPPYSRQFYPGKTRPRLFLILLELYLL